MRRPTETCVRWLCRPDRLEEILGDLAELRAVGGRSARFLRDALSLCLHQSRLSMPGGRRWLATGVAGLALLAAGWAWLGDLRGAPDVTIHARDAAGVFTLEIDRGRVRSASMDGLPLPPDRIEGRTGRVRLNAGDPARNLSIQLFPDGSIRWEGRNGRPAGSDKAPIEFDWARDYLAEAKAAAAEDGGALWGVDLHGPILLVDRGSRFLVANAADGEGLLEKRGGVWTGHLPRDRNIANTALDWAGRRWTMVIWPLPSDRYARRKLVFHELFHRIQPELGIGAEDVPNDHLAGRDGRIWLRLEWRALAEALVREGEERRRAVADALAFRARRHELHPGAAAGERALELNEGLAEYTGLVMSGLPRRVLADRAAVELGRRESQESYTRSFAYASGPAYGVLLDEADPDWRGGVSDETNLSALLAGALDLEVSAAGAEARAERYGAARVIAQEEARAERIAEREAELKRLLVDGPVLTAPVASSFRYSFDPNQATPMPGHGTVYESARVTDDWGVLEVEAGGVLFVRAEGGITRAVVPVEEGRAKAPLEGEGWRLELGPGWKVVEGESPGSWRLEPDE